MLTQRATLLGFVAFCFYLIAVVNSLPGFYYVLMWLALGLLAASLGIAFLSLSGLDFSWSLARSVGHATVLINSSAAFAEGASGERELEVPVIEATLSNRGSLNKTGILVELYLRDIGRERDVMLVYLLEAVPAGQTLDIALPLRELARGRYTLQRARLVGSDVLGLFRARRHLSFESENSEITVAPALLPTAPFSLTGRGGRAQRGTSRRARPGTGDELRGTRPYVAGDDMRQIHWKSTARTGELVMREWEQVGHAATMVVWDGAADSEWGAPEMDGTECGLVMVASLLATFAERALPCSLAVLGETARFCPHVSGAGGPIGTLGHEETEALAAARATRIGSLMAALSNVWQGAREIETLTIVTASLRPDVVEAVRSLRAQNVGTRVLLLDGAALGRASGDPRFVSRRAATHPPTQSQTQTAHEGAEPIAVTSAAFERQKRELAQAGAHVVHFAPQNRADIWPALAKAQRELLDPLAAIPREDEAANRAATARRTDALTRHK